jgi:hypothetical protein
MPSYFGLAEKIKNHGLRLNSHFFAAPRSASHRSGATEAALKKRTVSTYGIISLFYEFNSVYFVNKYQTRFLTRIMRKPYPKIAIWY